MEIMSKNEDDKESHALGGTDLECLQNKSKQDEHGLDSRNIPGESEDQNTSREGVHSTQPVDGSDEAQKPQPTEPAVPAASSSPTIAKDDREKLNAILATLGQLGVASSQSGSADTDR